TLRTWIGKRESLPEEKQFRLVLKYRDGITTIRDFKEVVNEKDKKD
ncbi:type IV conjugative transfer system protein TraE, partial [Salmonella enterica]|nr:type IV conjugative transfer system protein TraE [Salmonella enterica]